MFAFNESLPVIANASVLIDRTPEDIFHFIGERFFTNYPRWSPEVRELKPISPGPVSLGTRARQVRVDLGHRSESIFVVTIFQPGQRICFEGVSCRYRCDYQLKGIPSQSPTEVHFTFELAKLEPYLRPFEGLIRRAVQGGVQQTVRHLKGLVEAEQTERAAYPLFRHIPAAGSGTSCALRGVNLP